MIRADAFTPAFEAALAGGAARAGLTRRRGRMSRWAGSRPAGDLLFQFRINPKMSGIAGCPGELWAEATWDGPRHGPRDSGAVSFYQYTTEDDHRSLTALRRSAVDKAAAFTGFAHESERLGREALLSAILLDLEEPPRPQHPQHALYYFDREDAAGWGAWFGERLEGWIRRFDAAPETLEAWCWRVLWRDLPARPPPA